ncbi:MAG: tRNA pseudouridine synthase A [Saprospiraceae bacterium]|nr:tRNA pseudouridine synthase A [Saprospiraceae bacterium]MBL0112840.1 tRNA pseudouridine synthase A [Saprospiraceae bacterium]
MRYLISCSFKGTRYHGWQSQAGTDITVQTTLEKACATILHKAKIDIVGCGRTDAGVHALQYFAHFDEQDNLPPDVAYHLNAILPPDIAVSSVTQTLDDFHARYDAVLRTYEYHLHGYKSPFLDDLSYHFKFLNRLDVSVLQAAADLILSYDSFFPFCLSGSNLKHYHVQMKSVLWECPEPGKLVFRISANRFLRGMVRLIIGMCINVALGKLSLDQVKTSLDSQILLPKSLSVPAHGLYLKNIQYPIR